MKATRVCDMLVRLALVVVALLFPQSLLSQPLLIPIPRCNDGQRFMLYGGGAANFQQSGKIDPSTSLALGAQPYLGRLWIFLGFDQAAGLKPETRPDPETLLFPQLSQVAFAADLRVVLRRPGWVNVETLPCAERPRELAKEEPEASEQKPPADETKRTVREGETQRTGEIAEPGQEKRLVTEAQKQKITETIKPEEAPQEEKREGRKASAWTYLSPYLLWIGELGKGQQHDTPFAEMPGALFVDRLVDNVVV